MPLPAPLTFGGLEHMNQIVKDGNDALAFKHIDGTDRLEDIRQLFLEYSESLNIDLAFQDFETELNTLPGKYGPPDGALIIALMNDKPAGCIALRRLSDQTCEMKRLYVRKAYQGLGIGNQLIRMLIDDAVGRNYRYMRLDTLPTMKKAQDLYKSFGFYDIEPYVYNPVQGTRFMELELKKQP